MCIRDRTQGRDPFNTTVNTEIRDEVLTQMIENVLLAQAAEAENLEIDEVVIDEQITQLTEQYGGDEALLEQLAINGSSFVELQDDLRRSETVQVFVENYFEELTLVVTEDEMRATYDEAAATQEVPPFEEVQDQIEQELLQRKQQTAITSLLEVLTKKADIKKL